MIHLANGADVLRLLDSVQSEPALYKEATLCSPYIDDEMLARLQDILESPASRVVRVLTGRVAAGALQEKLNWHQSSLRKIVLVPRRLHAKVYVGLRRSVRESEAIVTSANLTRNGLQCNLEVGVRAVANCRDGARLFQSALDFVRQIIGKNRLCG